MTKLTRRQFIKLSAVLSVGGVYGFCRLIKLPALRSLAEFASNNIYLPLVNKKNPVATPIAPTPTATATSTRTATPTQGITPVPPPTGARVVHVYDPAATTWDGSAAQYWGYVNQSAVDYMVDRGLMALTGASTVATAWQALLPNYQSGQGIAIKVNFNNATNCSDTDSDIDAVAEPVNALIRGLLARGVASGDIWIYDAIRAIPDRFYNRCVYSGVKFFDNNCRLHATWTSNDPHATVAFSPPAGVPQPPTIRISDVLINATYLINVPIMKLHYFTGWSLSFKHHYGTINSPWNLHPYSSLDGQYYRSDYSPLVDIYKNPHVGAKTVLTLGDGIFGSFGISNPPRPWQTFGNRPPSSLFFATDPVAIDCVMGDLLAAETSVPHAVNDYLKIASAQSLGTYERGDPWGSGYNQIDYLRINL